MNLDRSLLFLLLVTMYARLIHAPSHLCETLAAVSGLQLWRLHPKALGAGFSSIG